MRVRLLLAVLGCLGAVAASPAAADISARNAPTSAPRTSIASENAWPGTTAWNAAEAPLDQIAGYASEISVRAGRTLHLHVGGAIGVSYRVEIYRLGWYGGEGGRLLACLPSCTGSEPATPEVTPPFDPATGYVEAGWPVTDRLRVPQSWVSGYYEALLRLSTGAQAGSAARIPFIVRAPFRSRSRILVQVPVNTWQAYNNWGGRSLYYPDAQGLTNNHVSFLRPYGVAAYTPQSKMYYELPLLHFLERRGYDLAYQTDVDTDANPASLRAHRLVIVAGHSEYWTKGIRDALEAARDAGVNLAFLGANDGYWQIRYENDRHTIVEYRQPRFDPEPDPALKTTKFRRLDPRRPECQLLGVEFQESGPGGASLGSVNDYTVADVGDRWFAGTGFATGDTLPVLAGGEWDNVGPGCLSQPVTVLFQYPGPPVAAAVRYRSASNATVFSAGSLRFVFGLDDNRFWPQEQGCNDPRLQRFMENVIADTG